MKIFAKTEKENLSRNQKNTLPEYRNGNQDLKYAMLIVKKVK